MATTKLVVRHDLDTLSNADRLAYLREVSVFIGLDPDLNGLDTIWMNNETGPGRSLVVYARRGTAEILRNLLGVEVESLTYAEVRGAIVFTATGRAKDRGNRQEVAVGSKYINGLTGKQLDDAIMTASTRALRRLTMQFTTLGILDESEVVALLGETPNPAGSALLSANPIPPVFAVPTVQANDAPGKDVTPTPAPAPAPEPAVAPSTQFLGFLGQQDQIDAAWAQQDAKKLDIPSTETTVKPVESVVTPDNKPDTETVTETVTQPKVRKPRKTKAVVLDVEPEALPLPSKPNAAATPPPAAPVINAASTEMMAAALPPAPVVSHETAPAPPSEPKMYVPDTTPGMPTQEQMEAYRKKVGTFTEQLTPGVGMGKTQKMRAFIAKMSGAAPQNMTVQQWDQMIAWFDKVAAEKGLMGLVAHIDATLGA